MNFFVFWSVYSKFKFKKPFRHHKYDANFDQIYSDKMETHQVQIQALIAANYKLMDS